MALDEKLQALSSMKLATLRHEWERMYRSPPPAGFGPDLLARAIAYALQERATGGLPRSVVREIRQGALDLMARSLSPDRPPPLRTGTCLTREWHGRTHHVNVVEGGFEYRERRYRSLTAIAREITGAAWSGPRFFGLTAPRSS